MTQRVRHWLDGLWQGSLKGGAMAAKAFLGAAGFSAMGVPIHPLDWRQALAVFFSGALWHFVGYLADNPFPGPDVQTPASPESPR